MYIAIYLLLALSAANAYGDSPDVSDARLEECIYKAVESGLTLPFKPIVPKEFIYRSLNPNGKYELAEGVIWSTKENIEYIWNQLQNNPDGTFKANSGLIRAKLSQSVAQSAPSKFSVDEKTLRQEFKKIGAKEILFKKLSWGEYPVIAVSAKFSNRKPVAIAWLGLNVGPTIEIDYIFPDKPGSYDNDWVIWNNFLSQTIGIPLQEVNTNLKEFFKLQGLPFPEGTL